MNCYRATQSQIELSGPTYFAPVLQQFVSYVQTCVQVNPNLYHILLILTDGQICDMPATKDAIVKASPLPCSIIIVGVGSADFSSMNELDSDGGLLRGPTAGIAARDIVQFVEFKAATI